MSKIKQNKEINEKPKYNIGQNQNHASWGLLIMVSQCEELCSYMLQFLGEIF